MRICFQHDQLKSLQAISYLLEREGSIEKVKLMKLLYLADRKSFIETGVPITGSNLYAMPFGPVPSQCLDLVNGNFGADVFRYIHLNDNMVTLRQSAGTDKLSEAERKVLDQILCEFGGVDKWKLVNETHKLPEYQACYEAGTSTLISFESIAKVSGNPRRYRLGRPVISPEMAAVMVCPFPVGSDATL